MKTALVIGFGMSGKSAAKYLLKRGWKVIATDREPFQEAPLGVTLLAETEPLDFSSFDLAVLSPGIGEDHPLVALAKEASLEVIGEIELALREALQLVIGITGTNGKTTVTLLIEHILNRACQSAKALGNVGRPLAEEIEELDPEDKIILELSSYQLDSMKTRALTLGLLLNITPDHLDRYGTMERYAISKCHIQDLLKEGGKLFVSEAVDQEFGLFLDPKRHFCFGYEKKSDVFTDLKDVYVKGDRIVELPKVLQGRRSHDLENFLAAFALLFELNVDPELIAREFLTFKKPSHRIEYVTEIQGVKFFDDSKGTNIDATLRAVESMKDPVHLIAGGVDKGWSYAPWLDVFQGKVKEVFAIGESAEKIAKDLSSEYKVKICKSLESAVLSAFESAKSGEIVLLSPGCSSFDMFKNYAHRGQEFQRNVMQLKGVKSNV